MSHCAFRFLLHQKHSLYVHHLLKKCVKMLALILVFCFLSHNLRFRYTKNILCTFTNCSKNFVKMLGLIFFFKSLVVSKVCFLSQTLPLSVSVIPKTFFVCSPIAHKIQCAHYAVFRFRYTNNILYHFFLWKHNTIINFF